MRTEGEVHRTRLVPLGPVAEGSRARCGGNPPGIDSNPGPKSLFHLILATVSSNVELTFLPLDIGLDHVPCSGQ